MSLGTIILLQVYRERGRGYGGHLSLGIMMFKCRTRKMEGHLSLGTIVLIVEPGEGGSFVSFLKCRTRETGVICL